MKQVVKITENELRNIIKECVLQYQQKMMSEGKLGNLARTAALGVGLAGSMFGGINNANAQNPNNISIVQTRDNLGRKTYKLQIDDQFDKDIHQQMQNNIALKKYQDSVAAEERRKEDSIAAEEIKNKYDTNVTVYNCKCTLEIVQGTGCIFKHSFSNLKDLFDTIPLVANKAKNKTQDLVIYNEFTVVVIFDFKGDEYPRVVNVDLSQLLYDYRKTFNKLMGRCIGLVQHYQMESLCKVNGLTLKDEKTSSEGVRYYAVDKNYQTYYIDFDKSSGMAKLVNPNKLSFGVGDL